LISILKKRPRSDYIALWITGESAEGNRRGHCLFFRVVPEQYPLLPYEEQKWHINIASSVHMIAKITDSMGLKYSVNYTRAS
jgi:hypothetical protein